MKLILCDKSQEIRDAWKGQFWKRPEVEIREADPLDTTAGALLVPGNSFGFLDSGLALRVMETAGWELEAQVRERIRRDHDGELFVGQALLLEVPALPRPIVYAPIWRTTCRPGPSVNAFLAMRGALLALRKGECSKHVESLAVPALGIAVPALGIAGLDPRVSARQIRYAYEIASGVRGPADKNLSQQMRRERKLERLPGVGEDCDPGGAGPPAPGEPTPDN